MNFNNSKEIMKKIIIILLVFATIGLQASQPAAKKQRSEIGGANLVDPNASFKDLILAGNVQEVSKRLEQDPSLINSTDEIGETPLMSAIRSDSLPMFMEIVNRPQNFNALNRRVYTALMYVAYYTKGVNSVLFARVLLQKGATQAIIDSNSRTVLMNAAVRGNLDLVKLLLETPFYAVAASAMQDINTLNINFKDRFGNSALMATIMNLAGINNFENSPSYIEIIKALIQKGADVNTINKKGETPLKHAIRTANINLVKFLLDNGANVNLQTNLSLPITFAISERNYFTNLNKSEFRNKLYEIIELLIAKGANLSNTPDNTQPGRYINSLSPIFYAASAGDYEIVRLLNENGAKDVEPGQSAFKLAIDNYNRNYLELNKSQKEDFLRTVRYLEDKFKYVVNEGNVAQAKFVLTCKHGVPEDLVNIVGEYITGSYKGDDYFIDLIKSYIHGNKFDRLDGLIKQKPEFLLIKNDLGETPLIAAVKEQSSPAVSIILNKLKDLPGYEINKLNQREKAVKDKIQGVPTEEQSLAGITRVPNKLQVKQLADIELERRNFTNKFHEQLNEAYKLANEIGNIEIISILGQYRNAFGI